MGRRDGAARCARRVIARTLSAARRTKQSGRSWRAPAHEWKPAMSDQIAAAPAGPRNDPGGRAHSARMGYGRLRAALLSLEHDWLLHQHPDRAAAVPSRREP